MSKKKNSTDVINEKFLGGRDSGPPHQKPADFVPKPAPLAKPKRRTVKAKPKPSIISGTREVELHERGRNVTSERGRPADPDAGEVMDTINDRWLG